MSKSPASLSIIHCPPSVTSMMPEQHYEHTQSGPSNQIECRGARLGLRSSKWSSPGLESPWRSVDPPWRGGGTQSSCNHGGSRLSPSLSALPRVWPLAWFTTAPASKAIGSTGTAQASVYEPGRVDVLRSRVWSQNKGTAVVYAPPMPYHCAPAPAETTRDNTSQRHSPTPPRGTRQVPHSAC